MEFVIKREQLLAGIGRAQSIVERRHTMPILANVLLEAQDKELTIKATDLEVGLAGTYPAQVKKAGRITAPARKLYEIIRELAHEDVFLKAKENNWMELKCGAALFNVVGLDASEYPALPIFEDVGFFSLSCKRLKDMLDMTLFAASTDETRYNLNGISWEVKGKNGVHPESSPRGDKAGPEPQRVLRLVATDGHRLSLIDWDEAIPTLSGLNITGAVILPRKGVMELRRLLEDAEAEENVEVCFQKNHGLFRRGSHFLVIRLIEGDFPDYEQVIPKGVARKAILVREAFLSALRRVSLLSAEKGKGVKFVFTPGNLEISARNPDLGEAQEKFEIEFGGKEQFAIAFNARYIIDILSVIKAEKVTFEFNDELSPGIIKPVSEEKHLSLVMPMRM